MGGFRNPELFSASANCQTSVLSLKTWSWLCFTPVTTTTRTRRTPHQISQLLLTRFWPNFKRRHLRTSRTDSNCYGDICPRNICPYQMLVAWFWLNFKGRFLGLSLTDANCYGDICQGNICPGNICPYQKYISCYWSDFDQTFWTQFLGAFFGPRNLLYPKLFDLNSFWPDFFYLNFFHQIFWTYFF